MTPRTILSQIVSDPEKGPTDLKPFWNAVFNQQTGNFISLTPREELYIIHCILELAHARVVAKLDDAPLTEGKGSLICPNVLETLKNTSFKTGLRRDLDKNKLSEHLEMLDEQAGSEGPEDHINQAALVASEPLLRPGFGISPRNLKLAKSILAAKMPGGSSVLGLANNNGNSDSSTNSNGNSDSSTIASYFESVLSDLVADFLCEHGLSAGKSAQDADSYRGEEDNSEDEEDATSTQEDAGAFDYNLDPDDDEDSDSIEGSYSE